jgi:hypothetical protein
MQEILVLVDGAIIVRALLCYASISKLEGGVRSSIFERVLRSCLADVGSLRSEITSAENYKHYL